MSTPPNELSQLSDQQRLVLEQLLVDFELAWNENSLAAGAATIKLEGPLRRVALMEMVKIDMERNWKCGRQRRLEDYLQEYPELGTCDTLPSDLVHVENEVRRQFGSLPMQFGRYCIVKTLGTGAMGTVYLAHDTQLDRHVALKIPQFSPQDEPAVLERFLREARAAAAIDHPNLCRVYDVGLVDGTPYFTMAYIEGPTLEQVLRNGPLPENQAADLVRRVAVGLAEAHRRGVIHRDLKPANILLTAANEPVVTDFGLARRLVSGDARITRSGSLLGSPAYLAPERIAGVDIPNSYAADIFALGVILYESLTGHLPFEGGLATVLVKIVHEEPVPPSVHRPGLDPRLEAICIKALAKSPSKRIASMQELAAALEPVSGNSILTTPWASRRKSLFAAGIIGALAILMVVVMIQFPPVTKQDKPATERQDVDRREKEKPISLKPVGAHPVEIKSGHRFEGHQATINTVGFSADGKYLVSCAEDNTIRKWDVAAAQEVRGYQWKTDRLGEGLILGPNNRFALARYSTGVELFDVEGKNSTNFFSISTHVGAIAFAGNGRRIIVAMEKPGTVEVVVVDLESGKRYVFEGHQNDKESPRCVALSADGTLAISAGKEGVRLWTVETGKEINHILRLGITRLAFSPDSKHFVTGHVSGELVLWQVDSAKELGRFVGHTGAINDAVFSADSNYLLTGSADQTVRLWKVDSFKELMRFSGHTGNVTCVAISPDGSRVASGAKDQTVRLWDTSAK